MAKLFRLHMTLASLLFLAALPVFAEDKPAAPASSADRDDAPTDVLPREEWKRIDVAVNRALTWLASNQRPDGSFPTIDNGQPGVTCLCAMSFMAHGHMVGEGR